MALSSRPAVTPEFLFEIRGSPPAIAMVTTGGQARKIEQIRNLLFFGMSVSRSKGGTSAIRQDCTVQHSRLKPSVMQNGIIMPLII